MLDDDPQQRLLLEMVYLGLEDAGISLDRVEDSKTGVFVGISTNDYSRVLSAFGADSIDSYVGTGNAASVAAGRISYAFGLRGPSFAVDTACSSSLFALHSACQSLEKRRERYRRRRRGQFDTRPRGHDLFLQRSIHGCRRGSAKPSIPRPTAMFAARGAGLSF